MTTPRALPHEPADAARAAARRFHPAGSARPALRLVASNEEPQPAPAAVAELHLVTGA